MGKKLGIFVAAAALLWTGCNTNSLNPAAPGTPLGSMEMTISTGDQFRDAASISEQPELLGIKNVWLTIREVQVHTSGGNGWTTVAQPNARFDFMVLVNGLTKSLKIYPLPAGKYTQIRLLLSEEGSANEVVIDGTAFPLKVPSGTQSGIKCNHPFVIKENQNTEICLEFDILKAIHYSQGQGYILHPTYKMIECEDSIDPDEGKIWPR